MPDIPSSPGRLDLGLDALLEDDGDRAVAGLAPARKLGQVALDEAEFLSPDQKRRRDAATPGPSRPAPARPPQQARPSRRALPLVVVGLLAVAALTAAAAALLG